ncbi:MAG: CBS domain-containing protein [Myxococcota bacterium]|nr:CBS domain-containing protein [Myxococcota bacterium]
MSHKVRDVMVSKVKRVSPETPLTEVERTLLYEHVGALPVVREGTLVGVVSRSDVVKHLQAVGNQIEGALSAYGDGSETAEELAEYRRQVTGAVAADRSKVRVQDVMTTDVVSVGLNATLKEAARLMVDHGIHRLTVVEGGELRGVLSSLDLAGLVADGRLVDA